MPRKSHTQLKRHRYASFSSPSPLNSSPASSLSSSSGVKRAADDEVRGRALNRQQTTLNSKLEPDNSEDAKDEKPLILDRAPTGSETVGSSSSAAAQAEAGAAEAEIAAAGAGRDEVKVKAELDADDKDVQMIGRVYTKPDISNHILDRDKGTKLEALLSPDPPEGNFDPPPSSDPQRWPTIFHEVFDILLDAHEGKTHSSREWSASDSILRDLIWQVLECRSSAAEANNAWRNIVAEYKVEKGGCIFREMREPKLDEDRNEIEDRLTRLIRVIRNVGRWKSKPGWILEMLDKIAGWTPDESEPLSLEWLRGETPEEQQRVLWAFKGVGQYVASSIMVGQLCYDVMPMGTKRMRELATWLGVIPERSSEDEIDAAKWINMHMPKKLMYGSFMLWWDHGRWCKRCRGNGGDKDEWTDDWPAPAFIATGLCPLEYLIDRRRGAPQPPPQAEPKAEEDEDEEKGTKKKKKKTKKEKAKGGSVKTKNKKGAGSAKKRRARAPITDSEDDQLDLGDSEDGAKGNLIRENYTVRTTRSGRNAGKTTRVQAVVEDDDELEDVDTSQDNKPPHSTASSYRARSASNNSSQSSINSERLKPEPVDAPSEAAASSSEKKARARAVLDALTAEELEDVLQQKKEEIKPVVSTTGASASSSSRKRAAAAEVEPAKGNRKQLKRKSLGTITLSSDEE